MEDGEMVRCEMRDGRGCRGCFRRLKVFWGDGGG